VGFYSAESFARSIFIFKHLVPPYRKSDPVYQQ